MSIAIWDNIIGNSLTPRFYVGNTPVKKVFVGDNNVWMLYVYYMVEYTLRRSDWTIIQNQETIYIPYWSTPSVSAPSNPRWGSWTSVSITPTPWPLTTNGVTFYVDCFYQIPWPVLTPVITWPYGYVYDDGQGNYAIGSNTKDIQITISKTVVYPWQGVPSWYHRWWMAEYVLLNNYLFNTLWINPDAFYQLYSTEYQQWIPIETADTYITSQNGYKIGFFQSPYYCSSVQNWLTEYASHDYFPTIVFSDDNYTSSRLYYYTWDSVYNSFSNIYNWYDLIFMGTTRNPIRRIDIVYGYNNNFNQFPFLVTAPVTYQTIADMNNMNTSDINWLVWLPNNGAVSGSNYANRSYPIIQPRAGQQTANIIYYPWWIVDINSPMYTGQVNLADPAITGMFAEEYQSPFVWIPKWVSTQRWQPEQWFVQSYNI